MDEQVGVSVAVAYARSIHVDLPFLQFLVHLDIALNMQIGRK